MSALFVLLMYVSMLAFDAAVPGSTGYLIAERNWSAWWMLAAVIVCTGSNPKYIIATFVGRPAQERPR